MALVVKDRVKETTTTTGTGAVTLLGAVTGFQSFSAIGNANTTYYTISDGTNWEVGIGTYTSAGTSLSRDTVLSSSNSDLLVNFPAGTKEVFVTYPSSKSIYQNGSSISSGTAILPVSNGGTGASTLTANGVLLGNGTSAISATAVGTTGQVLVGNTGAAPSWATLSSSAVTSFSAGTTGFTPSTATTGAITLAGTLNVANGGTGASTLTSGYLLKGNGASAVSASVVYDNGTNVGIGTASPSYALSVVDDGSYTKAGANSFSSIIYMNKGRGSVTAPTNISSGDNLGAIWFNGYSGSGNNGGYGYGAYIGGQADGPVYVATVPGRLVFATTSSGTSTPTERMRIDSSGNVGIGTTAPTKTLAVSSGGTATPIQGGLAGINIVNTDLTASGTSGITGALTDPGGTGRHSATIAFGKDGTWTTGAAYPGNIQFWTRPNSTADQVERMRIDSSGNVGIGTSSPSYKLETVINTTSNVGTRIQNQSTTQYAGAGINMAGPSVGAGASLYYYNNNVGGTQGAVSLNQTDVNGSYVRTLFNYDYTAQQWDLFTSGTQRLTINSSGNVGIGTSSPAVKLDVNGSINFGQTMISGGGVSTGDVAIELGGNRSGSGNCYIDLHSTNGTDFESRIIRYPGANGGMDITNSGTGALNLSVLGAGNIVFNNAGNERMRIDSSGSLLVGTTNTGYSNTNSMLWDTPGKYQIINHSGTSSGAGYILFGYNGGGIGSITQNGTTGVLYNITSDERLKENVADADDAASLIDAIKVRKFDWKSDGSHQRYGMVAQELLEVAPEAVSVPENEEDMMGVDYSKLVPMLIKEVQSLRARVAQLEGK